MRDLLRSLPVFEAAPPPFDPEVAPDDPLSLFTTWLAVAIKTGVPEPQAMTLSTCDESGRPDARALILKDVDEGGWYFATNRRSAKGQQLTAQPFAALTFYWPGLGRQVRVRGPVLPSTAEASAADFAARGAGARAVALASRESEPLRTRAECAAAVAAARARLADSPELGSPDWTLYVVVADAVEFWQADPERQHLRLQYRRTDGRWSRHLLWP